MLELNHHRSRKNMQDRNPDHTRSHPNRILTDRPTAHSSRKISPAAWPTMPAYVENMTPLRTFSPSCSAQ